MQSISGKHTKAALALFAVMGISTAINLFMFQSKRRAAKVETSAIASTGSQAAPSPDAFNAHSPIVLPSSEGATTRLPNVVRPPGEPAMGKAEIIRGIQRELAARGYEPGAADGMAGLVTRAAIMAYEHDNGLPLTAEATQELLGRIVLGPAVAAAARPGKSEVRGAEAQSVVRLVGQNLGAFGYKGTNTAGMLDEKLVKAIREFENDQKMPDTGRISAPLVSRLIRLQGQIKPAAQK